MAQFNKVRVVGAPEEKVTPKGKTMYKVPVVANVDFKGNATQQGMVVTVWEQDDIPAPGEYYLGARCWAGAYNEMQTAPVFIPVKTS